MIEFSIEVPLFKEYSGPDPDLKYPGEDDPVWCERCKRNHRRGAGFEVEQERAIRRAAQKIADKLDAYTLDLLK